jgi:hypothetical protein
MICTSFEENFTDVVPFFTRRFGFGFGPCWARKIHHQSI